MSLKKDLKNRVYTRFVWQWVNGVLREVPEEARWYEYEGPVAQATGMFTPAQNSYRFFADDGSESACTALGSQDTAYTFNMAGATDGKISLRVRIQETGGAAGATTDDFQLQRAINGSSTWVSITTSTTVAKGNSSANLTDQGATTNRLGAGSGSFVAGLVSEDGLADNKQITASNYTEFHFALTIPWTDVAHGDQITFRTLLNGTTMVYNIVPTLNISKTASAAFGDCLAVFETGVTSITNPLSATGSVSVAVGDLIVAGVAEESATATTTGITDNLGHTYTPISAAIAGGSMTSRVFYQRVTTAGTLTSVDAATTASTNNAALGVAVFKGPFATSPLDANPTAVTQDLTTPFDCPSSGTLSQADELIVGTIAHNLNLSAANLFQSLSDNWLVRADAPVLPNFCINARVVSATTAVAPQFGSQGAGSPTSTVLNTLSFKKLTGSDGAAAGTGAASGTGASLAAADSSTSAGTSTATATGASIAAAVGSASGTGSASATANANFDGVGAAAGVGDAAGVSPGVSNVGSAAGVGAANASGPTQWDIVKKSTTLSLSNFNLTFTGSSSGGRSIQANAPFTRNTYFEVDCNTATASVTMDVGVGKTLANVEDYLNGPGCGLLIATTGVWQLWDNNAQVSGASGTVAANTNHTVQVAYDPTNNKAYFGIDGTWVVGDPAAGTGGRTPAGGAGTYFAQADTETAAASGTANFGNSAFAYAAPQGFAGFEQIGSAGAAVGTSTASAQGASNVNIGSASGTSTADAAGATQWDTTHCSTSITLSNNLKTATPTGGGGTQGSVQATKALTGKKYWEYVWTPATGINMQLGIVPSMSSNFETWSLTGQGLEGVALVDQLWGNGTYRIINNTTQVVGNTAISNAAHTIGIAYDAPNKKFYISLDGTWLAGGDPSAGTGGITPLSAATVFYPALTLSNGGSAIVANFGTGALLTHPVPTGYVPLDQPDEFGLGAATGVGTATGVGNALFSAVGAAAGVGDASSYGYRVGQEQANAVYQAYVTAGFLTAGGTKTLSVPGTVESAAGQERLVAISTISTVGATAALFSSVTIDGQTASLVAARVLGPNSGSGDIATVQFWRAPGTATTSGLEIAMTLDGSSTTVGNFFVALYNLNNAGVFIANADSTSVDPSLNVNTGSGGTAVGASLNYGNTNTGLATWTGLIERLEDDFGVNDFTTAAQDFVSGEAPRSISLDQTPVTGQSSQAAQVVSFATIAHVGAAAGTGAASAVGNANFAGVGSAAGVGDASAVGTTAGDNIGSASGLGDATAVGASTAASIGSASGVGAASAVGASTAASVGSAAGVGAASAVGNANFAGVGSATGAGAASAVGNANFAGVGSATGAGAASAVGASTAASTGSASGVGAASATGASLYAGVGSAAGVGAASATGASLYAGVGSAAGVGAASASSSAGTSNGSAAGVGAASAVGQSTAASVGSATGTGTATGVGAALGIAVGSSAGTGTATGVGNANFVAVGSAAGTSTANAISVSGTLGSAAGVGAASAVGASLVAAVGSATGVGAASGVGIALFAGVGSASGVGAAAATGTGAAAAVGSAAGVGAASGVAPFRAVGSAAGAGAASAIGQSLGRGVGSAAGAGAASAVGIGGGVGAGSAAGVGAASAATTIAFGGAGDAPGTGVALGVGSQIGTSTRRRYTPGNALKSRREAVADPRPRSSGDAETRPRNLGGSDPRKKNFGS